MSIYSPDDRIVINPATSNLFFPLPTVVALDIQVNFPTRIANGFGSGITIAPNYVLTVAHNVRGEPANNNLRATTSANQNNLNSRIIGTVGDPAANVNDKIYITDYVTSRRAKDDILLLKTSNTLLPAGNVIGLMAFVNPRDAVGLSIRTAGYPADNVPNTVQDSRYNYNFDNPGIQGNTGTPGNINRQARDLVLAPGFLNSGSIVGIRNQRNFFFSQNIDSYRGQSGSGVWHTLEGDSKPRVLGVLTGKPGSGRQAIDGNGGVILTTELYDSIVLEILKNTRADDLELLPESAIIGSDSFLSFGGNDNIFGSFLRERILGNGGEDRLFGGSGDDRLEGGDGTDQALFTDVFINYDWTITDPSNPAFEFNHARGSQSDGKDTTKDIEFGTFEFVDANKDGEDDDGELFFVPLQVDPDDPTKLKDGALIHPKEKVLDDEGEEIGTITVESPAWMFDGDVKYNLSIGLDTTQSYNIALIVDRSGSMSGSPLAQTKSALNRLINSFEQSGIDSNIDFGIVDFNSTARLYTTSDSSQAETKINGLVAGGGTAFSNALSQASIFFSSVFRNNNAEDIAYFISDGIPGDPVFFPAAAARLKLAADVRAFGIGGASLGTLNIIDSDGNAELLGSAGDLFDAFDTSIDRDAIDRIEVRLEGIAEPIQIISPDELSENGFNLTYEGTIEGLEVSREAENNITFELVFKEEAGIDNVLLNYKITTGQEEVRQQTNDGRNEVINFGVNQSDFTDSINESFSLADSREIVGNSLGNTFQISDGSNTISGNGGNDRFVLFGGSNFVDGGNGVDTIEIGLTKAEAGDVSKSGDLVNIGTNIAAKNVEYIEFTDVLLAVDTLLATPVISFVDTVISTPEGDSESTFATFNLNLSSVATEDVVINVSARSDIAETGIDFIEPTAQFTIAAGESSGNLSLEILGDTDIEGNEEIYLDLTIANSATFADGVLSNTVGVNILDNETNFITDEDTLITISASRLLNDYASKLYGEYTENDFSIVEVNSADGTAILNTEGNVEFTPAANLNGTVSFELTVTDGTENYTDLVEISVNPINDVLIANNDTLTTEEDTPITILPSQLFGNDINNDVERSLNISQTSNLTNGTAVLSKAGIIRFTPNSNFNGIASFDYTVTDGIDSETASVEITVDAVNDILIANSDTVTTDEDTPLTILASDLFANDVNDDIEKSLNISQITNLVNGSTIINSNGNIEFAPNANFHGTANFDYTVTDGTDIETASVEIVVNSVNDILIVNNDVATTDEDTPLTILASDLFANDVNDDRAESRIGGITNLVGGTAFVDSDGNIRFTPDSNFSGTASFDYTVTDGIDNETASVEVTVNPVDDAPLVSNDTASAIDEDTSLTISATELLANDSDVEGDSLSIIEVNSSDGTAVINAEGNIDFTPNANFNGIASFDYIVTDGTSNSTASVEVVVNPINDVLIANSDTVTTNEDTPITILKSDLFANDINDDIEKSLNISQVTNAVNGTAIINSGGNVEFTADAHFYGTASFDYTVTDGTDIETASVEVLVNSVDDAPIGNNDTATTDEDTPITISATELLSNDINYDPEDSLSIVGVSNSANGTAIINSDGNIEFAPDANFYGTGSFDYTVTDGKTDTTASVAVSVTPVNDPLVLTTSIPNITVGQKAPNSVIVLSDYFEDIEDDDNNIVYGISYSASYYGGGDKFFDVFEYDSPTKSLTLGYIDGIRGTATFEITATDRGGASVETSFTVTVEDTVVETGLNDDTVTTDEDTTVTILAADLLSNDIGDSLSVVGVENAVNGTVVLNGDGNIEFTPDADFNGTASFDYLASDGTETNTALVEVTVNPVNDTLTTTNPILDISVGKNAPNTVINLNDYFADVDGADDVSYSVKTSSSFTGSSTGKFYDLLSLDSTTGLLTLDYENNVVGTSTVTVTATDGGNESITTSFTVTVTDTVVETGLNNDSITTDEDTPVTVLASELLSNDTGSNLSLIGVENSVNGTVFLNEAGEIEFTPAPDFNGTASFDYIVSDGTETDTASVEVTVNPINDVPVLTKPITDFTVTKNAPNSMIEIANYFDDVEDGSNLAYSFSASSSFSGGNSKFFDSFSSNSVTKALTLDYADGVVGTSTIRVTATDSGNESVETNFTVSVIDSTENDDSLVGGNGNDYLAGLQGNDILFGNAGNDILLGGAGSDSLEGGGDNDTYIYNLGDGSDVISDYDYLAEVSNGGDGDTLRFGKGISRNNLSWSFLGEDLVFTFADAPDDSLTISNYTNSNYLIENIEVEGSLLTAEEINSALEEQPITIGEFGRVAKFNHNRQTIELNNSYDNPVVFALPLSRNGGDPAIVRITDIQSNSFTAYLQEAEYKDGKHVNESFSYMVLEEGDWELSDGTLLEVGTIDTNRVTTNGWEDINFDVDFDSTPAILSQVQTKKGGQFVRTRQRQATIDGFRLSMEEEEALKKSGHLTETVGWLAIESGTGDWGDLEYQAGHTGNVVNHRGYNLDFDADFETNPLLFASLASFNGGDSAGLRYRNLNNTQVNIMVEEDQSLDSEIGHVNEIVDFLAISGTGDLAAIAYEPVELI